MKCTLFIESYHKIVYKLYMVVSCVIYLSDKYIQKHITRRVLLNATNVRASTTIDLADKKSLSKD